MALLHNNKRELSDNQVKKKKSLQIYEVELNTCNVNCFEVHNKYRK